MFRSLPSILVEIARNYRFGWEIEEELHEEGKRIVFVYYNVGRFHPFTGHEGP
jgi:2-phosphoglycerate kinase